MHDDEQDLARRLGAYESRLPDTEPPSPIAAQRRRAPSVFLASVSAVAAAAAGALAIAVLLATVRDVGVLDPTGTLVPPTLDASHGQDSAAPMPTAGPGTASGEPSPSATRSPAPSPPSASLPSRSAPPMAAPRWEEGSTIDGLARTAVWLRDRWYVGGTARDGRAAIWSSTDGRRWTAAPALDPAEAVLGSSGSMYSVVEMAEWRGTIYAFGAYQTSTGDGYGTLWTSVDGTTWDYVDLAGTPFDEQAVWPQGVLTDADDRLLVVASAGAERDEMVVFASGDGSSWTAHPVRATDGRAHNVNDAAGGRGLFVAVGSSGFDTHEGTSWLSSDGTTWAMSPTSGDGRTYVSVAFDVRTQRFVAIGHSGRGSGSSPAWASDDGSSWSPMTMDARYAAPQDLAAADGTFVAVGITTEGPTQSVAWISSDARTWTASTIATVTGSSHVGIHGGQALVVLESTGDPAIASSRIFLAEIEP